MGYPPPEKTQHQDIIDILPEGITRLERERLISSFKVENVVDHIGTSSAITNYVLSMLMIRQGQRLGGFTYDAISNIGLIFSFGCALSFTSSSFDLLQDYRRVHFRLKLVETRQLWMILVIKLILSRIEDEGYASEAKTIVDQLSEQANAQLKALKREYETLQLLVNSDFLGGDEAEQDQVSKELSDIDHKMTFTQHYIEKLATINIRQKENINFKQAFSDHAVKINDILHRPLYAVDRVNDAASNRFATLSSTSLYAKRNRLIHELAVLYPFTQESAKSYDTDEALSDEVILATSVQAVSSDSVIFKGCADSYLGKKRKYEKYLSYPQGSLKAEKYKNNQCVRYLQVLHELENIDLQVSALESMIKPIDTKALTPGSVTQQVTLAAPVDLDMSVELKPFKPRTLPLWAAEWKEIKDFFGLIKEGLGLGIDLFMKPDDEKFRYRTQVLGYSRYHPKLWGYSIKKKIDSLSPIKKKMATFAYLLISIPYFIYYALKHFAYLLDGLQTVVDGIHKAVRDVDHVLSYRQGDGLRMMLTYPVKVLWALICFIPETLGGMAYWSLTAIRSAFMSSAYTVAHTSRAINPGWLADWVEVQYLQAHAQRKGNPLLYRVQIAVLYFITLLGGVYNTFATLIKKVIPFYPIQDQHIDASRHQLSIAGGLFKNSLISAYRYLVRDPITSTLKQSQQELHTYQQAYPFNAYPLTSLILHAYVGFKLVGNLISNVLLLGIYRTVKELAKTAPIITATVVVCSTIMPGFALPFYTLSFIPETQMILAVISMCGDCTNGTHDVYNLANNLKRKYRYQLIEHGALSQMQDKSNGDEYKMWVSIFEHIEVGHFMCDALQGVVKQAYDSDSKYHAELVLGKRNSYVNDDLYEGGEQGLARQLLAHHLALHCVNHLKCNGQEIYTYDDYYYKFLNSQTISDMAVRIASTLPTNHTLTKEQQFHSIAGLSVLAGYEYSRCLLKQVVEAYNPDQPFEPMIVNVDTGITTWAQRINEAPEKTCLFSRSTLTSPLFKAAQPGQKINPPST